MGDSNNNQRIFIANPKSNYRNVLIFMSVIFMGQFTVKFKAGSNINQLLFAKFGWSQEKANKMYPNILLI